MAEFGLLASLSWPVLGWSIGGILAREGNQAIERNIITIVITFATLAARTGRLQRCHSRNTRRGPRSEVTEATGLAGGSPCFR